MASLKGNTQGGGRSSGDMPEDVGFRGGILLRRVAVTMKGMQAADKMAAAMEPRDELLEMWWREDRQCSWRMAMK